MNKPVSNFNSDAIVQSRIQPQISPALFVNRQLIEQELAKWLAMNNHTTLIVYGPRGAGKTALVHNALAHRTGVIDVKVGAETPSIACAVVEKLNLTASNKPMLCKRAADLKQLFLVARTKLHRSLWSRWWRRTASRRPSRWCVVLFNKRKTSPSTRPWRAALSFSAMRRLCTR